MATLVSVNVGMPKDLAWRGRTIRTGIYKVPVDGPRMVRRLNIDGDGQGDLAGHGGEQRAVLVYQVQSYAYWAKQLGRDDLSWGNFGENFTVDGLGDDEACVGDRYRIGTAEFEVTQPRVTCFRVGMRLDEPEMPSLLVSRHRPGFYLRVLTEGPVQAGDEIVRTRRGPHAISVADIDALLYLPGRDRDLLRDAGDIPALSPGWQQSFRELLAPPVAPSVSWPGFRELTVTDVVAESPAITSIRFAAQGLPAPLPGQFLTLRVPGDPGPVRSYSLSSGDYRISVKREAHGVASSWLQANARPGTVLLAAAPRGDFVLADGNSPVALISAGIGVTPVLAMLHRLAEENSAREIWWVRTVREPGQLAFAAETRDLLDRLPNVHEHVFYSAQRRLDPGALAALGVPAGATAYVCGPEAFMTMVRETLTPTGIDVRTENFGALDAINPGSVGAVRVPVHQPPGEAGTGPLVTFARSGLSVRSSPAYGSLLDLAEACDVPTRYSCRNGVCHTCVTPLVSGSVTYHPEPLEQPAAGDVLVCCSRPDGDLVLDL
jgi:ferredoxin-NADP reductase/MOSC domain-containing protein YiiM